MSPGVMNLIKLLVLISNSKQFYILKEHFSHTASISDLMKRSNQCVYGAKYYYSLEKLQKETFTEFSNYDE